MKHFISDIVKNNDFKLLYVPQGSDPQLTLPGINRAGLELIGFVSFKANRRVAYLGRKEAHYLSTLINKKDYVNSVRALLLQNIPLLVLGPNFTHKKQFIKIAKECKQTNTWIVSTHHDTGELFATFGVYLENLFAKKQEIHGTLLEVFGSGILILGKSGLGKSELTLDLINNSHSFVADDRVIVTNRFNSLYGSSHPILKDLIEIRGLGVMNLRSFVGSAAIIDEVKLFGVVELVSQNDYQAMLDNAGRNIRSTNPVDHLDRYKILNNELYYLRVPVLPGRNLLLLTEWAVRFMKNYDYMLNSHGEADASDISNVINQRLRDFMQSH